MSPVRAQVGEQEVRAFRGKQRGEVGIVDVIRISPAMRVLLDRQRARAVDPRIGPVFPTPRRNQPCTESGFKSMWNKLTKKAIAAGIVTWRFTFHDLRAYYYATQHKRTHGTLPDLHKTLGRRRRSTTATPRSDGTRFRSLAAFIFPPWEYGGRPALRKAVADQWLRRGG
jgi:integrase